MVLLPLWRLLRRFWRALRASWRDENTRGLVALAGIIIAMGTILFRFIEGWSWLDSFYFTVITLTTVGYGDLAPQTPAGKIVTVIFLLVGLGIIASFIRVIARQQQNIRAEDRNKRQMRKLAQQQETGE